VVGAPTAPTTPGGAGAGGPEGPRAPTAETEAAPGGRVTAPAGAALAGTAAQRPVTTAATSQATGEPARWGS
jgi:hypothetical protein